MGSGCAINPQIRLDEIPGSQNRDVLLTDVPFYAQETDHCGPAALAGVLGAAGVPVLPDDLAPQVFLPGRKGSLQVEMMAATRRHGRIAYTLEPDPAAIIREIDAGRPVLVLQNLRTPGWPAWHYAVVVGYETGENRFILNSGADRNVQVDAGRLMRTWNWADRWAMVALRPEEFPADADPKRYMRALADFSGGSGEVEILNAWQSAASMWPDESWPYLAIGNIAYRNARFDQAIAMYRQGLALQPGDPALTNNLASTLGETGCARMAEAWLEPVYAELPPDSVWRSVMERTKSELEEAPGGDPALCREAFPASTNATTPTATMAGPGLR